MLAYNTSYHSTIATTPFKLLFGVKPRLPSLPAPDIERVHYGESFAAEQLQILQHARKMAHDTTTEQGKKYKLNYDVKAAPHKFIIGQKIFLNDSTSLGKNSKLSPNWTGPYDIIDINDNNAKIKIKNKLKVVNIARIKPFLEEPTTRLSQDDSSPSQGSPTGLDQGHTQGFPKQPMTRAFQKLQDLKNAASLAIAILTEENKTVCYGNIFDENYDKNHCQNCKKGIKNFLKLPNIKEIFQKHYVPLKNVYESNSSFLISEDESVRTKNKEDQENLIKVASFQENDADPRHISTIKEALRQSLLSVASKLLSKQHITVDQLSKEEQDLWNSYDNSDIYEFLTGEKDTLPEFEFDWIVTDPKLRLPNDWKDLIPPQPQPKPPQVQPPPALQLPPPLPAQIPDPNPPDLPQPPQAPPTVPQCDRVLRNKTPVDYKELHTGIKRKCKTLR